MKSRQIKETLNLAKPEPKRRDTITAIINAIAVLDEFISHAMRNSAYYHPDAIKEYIGLSNDLKRLEQRARDVLA